MTKRNLDAAFKLAWTLGWSSFEHQLAGNSTRNLKQKAKVRFLQLLLTEPVAWQARKLKDGKDWGPPGTNRKAFDQLAAEGYEIRALRA